MPADDIRMCEWADSRNHAGENRNRGKIMKRREWASLIILALAAVPALLVAIGQVYVTGVDGIRLRRPETIELLAEIIVLFFLYLFAIWKIDRNRLRAGAALLITAGFLWIHQAFTAMFLSGAYVLVLLMARRAPSQRDGQKSCLERVSCDHRTCGFPSGKRMYDLFILYRIPAFRVRDPELPFTYGDHCRISDRFPVYGINDGRR